MKQITTCIILTISTLQVWSQSKFDQSVSVKAANAILASFSPAQKNIANLPFADSSRVKWSNLPMEQAVRHGIQMKDLSDSQRVAIHTLLRTVLSSQGYQKMMFIIQYDEATHERLAQAQSPIAHRYGNQNYWFTIFGTPDVNKIWAWKFEGHHISLNFTYSPKGVTCTPMFVGVNPALTTAGAYAGYHVMFEENDLGNQLFNSFNEKLKQKAIVGTHPTDADVMTQTGKEPHMKDKKGVSYSEMNTQQKVLVENIIKAWIENLTSTLAQEKINRVLSRKNELLFVWRGTKNVQALHYYAVKTPNFIIEFTNRDGGIHHYHTLWRDLTEDFSSK